MTQLGNSGIYLKYILVLEWICLNLNIHKTKPVEKVV